MQNEYPKRSSILPVPDFFFLSKIRKKHKNAAFLLKTLTSAKKLQMQYTPFYFFKVLR